MTGIKLYLKSHHASKQEQYLLYWHKSSVEDSVWAMSYSSMILLPLWMWGCHFLDIPLLCPLYRLSILSSLCFNWSIPAGPVLASSLPCLSQYSLRGSTNTPAWTLRNIWVFIFIVVVFVNSTLGKKKKQTPNIKAFEVKAIWPWANHQTPYQPSRTYREAGCTSSALAMFS